MFSQAGFQVGNVPVLALEHAFQLLYVGALGDYVLIDLHPLVVRDVTPIAEDTPEAPAQPLRRVEARRRPDDLRECAAHGLGAVSLRYFNVAGATARWGGPRARDPPHPQHPEGRARRRGPTSSVFGTDYPTPDGTAMRDYIHIDDLADAHVLALERRAGAHQILNLGNGSGFSRARGHRGRARGDRATRSRCTRRRAAPATRPARRRLASAIRAELGWARKKPGIERSCADAWAWHQAHPDGYPLAAG